MVQQARQAESSGNMKRAGQMYFSLLNNNCVQGGQDVNIPLATKIALGRRAVGCLTIAARQELSQPNVDVMTCEANNYLQRCYKYMSQFEPSSPTWPYLEATQYCALGQYVEARNALRRAVSATGGQPSVRAKAQQLLAHINGFADSDYNTMAAQDRQALQYLLSGQAAADYGPAPVSSEPEMSRGERHAREHGDTAAAERFKNGNTLNSDREKYNY